MADDVSLHGSTTLAMGSLWCLFQLARPARLAFSVLSWTDILLNNRPFVCPPLCRRTSPLFLHAATKNSFLIFRSVICLDLNSFMAAVLASKRVFSWWQ